MDTEWARCKSSNPKAFYDGARKFVTGFGAVPSKVWMEERPQNEVEREPKSRKKAARAAAVVAAREEMNDSFRISNGSSNSTPAEDDIPEGQATSNPEKKL